MAVKRDTKKSMHVLKTSVQSKEVGQAGTIGAVFDFYYKRGYQSMPSNVLINAGAFRGRGSGEIKAD